MKRLAPWLKLAFSLVMVAYILAVSHPRDILHALASSDLWLLLAGTGLWIVIQLLNVLKWQVLNRAQGMEVPYRRLLDVYYIGMFFNTFLPSGFGGDAVRAYELSRLTSRGGASLSSIVVDRYASLFSLILLGSAAIIFAPAGLEIVPKTWACVFMVVGGLGFWVLLQDRWLRAASRMQWLARWPKLGGMLAEMAESAQALRTEGWAIGLSLLISLVFQFLTVVQHYFFIRALDLDVTFGYALFFIPLLTLVASLPISINGLGIREGGYAYFLGRVGVGSAEAVSIGLLSLSMLLLSGLWGAFVYATTRQRRMLAAGVPHRD